MTAKAYHFWKTSGVERPAKSGRLRYVWHVGYCLIVDGCNTAPWLTRREAIDHAKRDGRQAVFHDTESEARAAIRNDK